MTLYVPPKSAAILLGLVCFTATGAESDSMVVPCPEFVVGGQVEKESGNLMVTSLGLRKTLGVKDEFETTEAWRTRVRSEVSKVLSSQDLVFCTSTSFEYAHSYDADTQHFSFRLQAFAEYLNPIIADYWDFGLVFKTRSERVELRENAFGARRSITVQVQDRAVLRLAASQAKAWIASHGADPLGYPYVIRLPMPTDEARAANGHVRYVSKWRLGPKTIEFNTAYEPATPDISTETTAHEIIYWVDPLASGLYDKRSGTLLRVWHHGVPDVRDGS